MTEPTKPENRKLKWPSKRLWLYGVLAVVAALFLSLGYTVATGGRLPGLVKYRFEQRLNASLEGGSVELGSIRLRFAKSGWRPVIAFDDLVVFGSDGGRQVVLPKVETLLDGGSLMAGVVRPLNIIISDAKLTLVRDASAKIDISFGASGRDGAQFQAGGAVADVLGQVEAFFERPFLSQLVRIESRGMSVEIVDGISQRNWTFSDGLMSLALTDDALTGSITTQQVKEGSAPATATLDFKKQRGTDQATINTRFEGFSSVDVADQLSALDWLRVLDAPISGSIAMSIEPDGNFQALDGVLDIGSGHLRGATSNAPVKFNSAKIYLTYDAQDEKMSFAQISVDTDAVSVEAEGHAYLSDRIDRSINALIGQFKFRHVTLKSSTMWEEPVTFTGGVLDMRTLLSPVRVDIGQLVLFDDDTRFFLDGWVALEEAGLAASLDFSVDALHHKRLTALWPKSFKPKTRKWVATNISAGTIRNVAGAVRVGEGAPQINIGFDMQGVTGRYMKTLPPIENAAGYGVITGQDFRLVLEEGTVTAPNDKPINVAGSSIYIPDITIKGAPAEIKVHAQSAISAALALMDLEPFGFVSKMGVGYDIAQGITVLDARLRLPLKDKVGFDEVDVDVTGSLNALSSTELVQGKVLTADRLVVRIDNDGMSIGGNASLGQVPVSGVWTQMFGPEHVGKSAIEGTIELSDRFMREFSVGLPDGSVSGVAIGNIAIALEKDKPPEFSLTSDLNRVTLQLAALGWRKPANKLGTLAVRGKMGAVPAVESFVLTSAGLDVEGTMSFKPGGGLDVARFYSVELDNWLSAPIELRGQENGEVAIVVTGGSIDFRKSKFGNSNGATGGGPLLVKLNSLRLSDSISLTNVEGDFRTNGGLNGSFSGDINGGARIVGTVAPMENGTGVRFTSSDAGAVMRSAGVFSKANGGRLDMVLLPTGDTGHYRGGFNIANARIQDAPALAELLNAISVVGLLEQLSGEGLMFGTIDGKFRLSPDRIALIEAAAVGPSLGISMAGNYLTGTGALDMEGVITPIYVLNGMLEQTKLFGGLFGKKKGEGLFGFNYVLKGTSKDPQVSVNPLSILTPGVFRDIFRQPVPTTP